MALSALLPSRNRDPQALQVRKRHGAGIRSELSAGYPLIDTRGDPCPAVTPHPTSVFWILAPSRTELDPARCLGELPELPAAVQPGDWCTIVAVDDRGEMRLTLVALEVERTTSLFVERRGGTAGGRARPVGRRARPVDRPAPERVPERDGTDGTAAPARGGEGGATRLAAGPGLRRG